MLTATSANRSGMETPMEIGELMDIFGNEVDLYVKGPLPLQGKPSTVVRLTGRGYKIIRKGIIPENVIKKAGEFGYG